MEMEKTKIELALVWANDMKKNISKDLFLPELKYAFDSLETIIEVLQPLNKNKIAKPNPKAINFMTIG